MTSLINNHRIKQIALALVVASGVSLAQQASANILINENFNSAGTFADTGLQNMSNAGSITLAGVNGSKGLDTANGGFVGSGVLAPIPSSTTFSFYAGLGQGTAVVNDKTGGAFLFGYSHTPSTTTNVNNYSGIGVDTVGTDHLLVGVMQIGSTTGAPSYRLAWGNGATQVTTNQFGSPAVVLTQGNWFHVFGTYDYNSATDEFTFNVTVDDMGATGASLVTAGVLSGSTTISLPSFTGNAQPVFLNNQQRGSRRFDNLYAEALPEPATLALLAGGLLLIGSRRRKQA